MLNYMASYLKKFYSFSGLVCDHFSRIFASFLLALNFDKSELSNQQFRTSKYIDPSNKFELDNQVDIYKVKTGLFSNYFCQSCRRTILVQSSTKGCHTKPCRIFATVFGQRLYWVHTTSMKTIKLTQKPAKTEKDTGF